MSKSAIQQMRHKRLLWNQHPAQLLYWSACPCTFHGEVIFPHLSLVSTMESKYRILLKSQCSEPYRLKILKTRKIFSFNSQKNANIRTEMYHMEKCWIVHSRDFSSRHWRNFPWTTWAVQFSWGAWTHTIRGYQSKDYWENKHENQKPSKLFFTEKERHCVCELH